MGEIMRFSDRGSLMMKHGFEVKRDGESYLVLHKGRVVATLSSQSEVVAWFCGYLYGMLGHDGGWRW